MKCRTLKFFTESSLSVFFSYASYFFCVEIFALLEVTKIFLLFFSRRIILLGITFKSMFFVYIVKYGSKLCVEGGFWFHFCFLDMLINFSSTICWKYCSTEFLLCLIENQLSIYVWVCFWAPYSVLFYISVLTLIWRYLHYCTLH